MTDNNASWRPNYYQVGLLPDSNLSSYFIVVKLVDYRDKQAELEASNNPFASVILAQLAAIDSRFESDKQRKNIKFNLTKRLYNKGFNKKAINSLYKFIDWLICLPEPLEIEYLHEIYELEESKKMPYISTAERLGIEKGIQQGIEQGIEQEKMIVAERLILKNITETLIAEITDLSLEQIKKIKENLS